ncbi:E3 ubiquitin ligase TRAF3IP2 [Grus japonensis]|uniref:E3 ubiquitin ligase TRAF3IP2 n=1 Tax=Grus japonensis TaxID=30415 RepID=A0ABC9WPC2_GRUJA
MFWVSGYCKEHPAADFKGRELPQGCIGQVHRPGEGEVAGKREENGIVDPFCTILLGIGMETVGASRLLENPGLAVRQLTLVSGATTKLGNGLCVRHFCGSKHTSRSG